MASLLTGRPPTCLSCLRRIISPSTTQTGSASVALTQVRGKKTEGRLRDPGVVVRLLKDVPKIGPEGSVVLYNRHRMRYSLFPNSMAEYVTRERFKELKLSKADIGKPDPMFGVNRFQEDDLDTVEAVAGLARGAGPDLFALAGPGAPGLPAVEIEHIAPNRALELMQAMIPDPIVFERRLVHAPTDGKIPVPPAPAPEPAEAARQADTPSEGVEQPKKALSPLEARRAMLRAQADPKAAEQEAAAAQEREEKAALERAAAEKLAAEEAERERQQQEREYEESIKIHGSVTLRDIASFLRDKMLLDPEASRINVQAEEIKFVGLDELVDKIEKIGSFEIEVRTHVGKSRVEPIRRKVNIVPHWS